MSQKLILPIPAMKMTAAYLNEKYKAQFGFAHYGIDAVSTTGNASIYALGNGEIIAAGQDGSALTGSNSRLGNCIVVIYKDVLCNDGKTHDLACRIFHMDSIAVKKGDIIKAGTFIGKYGNTGANTTGAHLHIEFDTDIQYPQYAYGIAASGNVIKKGTINSTVNPSKVWYIGDGQSVVGYGNGYTSDIDVSIPICDDVATLKRRISELEAENKAMKADIAGLAGKYK